ncbi:hypothetical protein ACFQYP_47620 [Nonomuraea antimicrobica]
MKQLQPCAGATKSGRCPKTTLTSPGHQSLTVTDPHSGNSLTLTPARLLHYSHDLEGDRQVQGVAALGDDGLVLLDLSGDWHAPHLEEFARRAGIPLYDARRHPSNKVRAILASRAAGWQRIHGLKPLPRADGAKR